MWERFAEGALAPTFTSENAEPSAPAPASMYERSASAPVAKPVSETLSRPVHPYSMRDASSGCRLAGRIAPSGMVGVAS